MQQNWDESRTKFSSIRIVMEKLFCEIKWAPGNYFMPESITPLCLNSLWPNDAIRQQRSGSTLAQVITWTNLDLPSLIMFITWTIFMDLSKAFDTLNHNILLVIGVTIMYRNWHSFEYNFTRYFSHQSLKLAGKLLSINFFEISQGSMS